MADDELILSIDKAFWPKGVVRGLTPVLRALGDKHGNLVIAAKPLTGEILVKGSADQIESAKEGLREIIEEHFPDAPIPDELEDGTQPVAGEDEAPDGPEERSLDKAEGQFQSHDNEDDEPWVRTRRPRASSAIPADLMWQCIRKSSCFTRKSAPYPKRLFSMEPNNIMGLHSQRYSGLADEVLGVHAIKNGIRETIELTKSRPKPSKQRKPATAMTSTGLSKCKKKGLKQLDREIGNEFYRRDLLGVAKRRYERVLQSFRKNRLAERSQSRKAGNTHE